MYSSIIVEIVLLGNVQTLPADANELGLANWETVHFQPPQNKYL